MVTKFAAALDEDPAQAGACRAPHGQCSPEELAAIEQGLDDFRAGRTVMAEQIRARLRARDEG